MRDSSSQRADYSSFARPGGGASSAGAVGGPGKRTLVEGLGAPQGAGADYRGADPSHGDTEYDGKVTTVIHQLLTGYQAMQISVPAKATSGGPASPLSVTVSTPYYNNKYETFDSGKAADNASNPQPSSDFNTAARVAAEKAFGALDAKGNPTSNTRSAQWQGKGSPDEIKAIVNLAVAPPMSAIRPAGDANDPVAWKTAIETWMRTVGLGVDCNGLVYEALLQMRDGDPHAVGATKNYGGGAVNNILNAIRTDPPQDRDAPQDHRTLASIDLMGQLGISITAAADLRPGDVMVVGIEHVRIVESVEPYDTAHNAVTFTTVEANVDKRPATIDGVYEQKWIWTQGGTARKLDTNGAPVGDGEKPVFQRHLVDPPDDKDKGKT
jgi:hypothetical protein